MVVISREDGILISLIPEAVICQLLHGRPVSCPFPAFLLPGRSWRCVPFPAFPAARTHYPILANGTLGKVSWKTSEEDFTP